MHDAQWTPCTHSDPAVLTVALAVGDTPFGVEDDRGVFALLLTAEGTTSRWPPDAEVVSSWRFRVIRRVHGVLVVALRPLSTLVLQDATTVDRPAESLLDGDVAEPLATAGVERFTVTP